MSSPSFQEWSIDYFLKYYLPVNDGVPSVTLTGFTDMARAASEREMQGFFVMAVNSILTRFTAFDVPRVPFGETPLSQYPSVIIHQLRNTPISLVSALQTMDMFVEFNHGDSADPFPSNGALPPKRPNANARPCLNQIIFNLIRQQGNQFRNSIFTVGIFGEVARIIRWDRSGCRVTAEIHYSTEEGNRQLTEFFLRFDRMAGDPEARGWDPNVSDATAEEVKIFAQAVEAVCVERPKSGRMMTRTQKKKAEDSVAAHPIFCTLVKSVGDPGEYPRKKVPVMDGEISRDYIVGRPAHYSKTLTGRITRKFVAMSAETKALVFLTETWRVDTAVMPEEDYFYKCLLSKKSPGSTTLKDTFAYSLYERQETGVGYVRYRMVQPELFIPLLMFRDSKHLTSIMLDIAQALEFIHGAGIFHFNLNIGNIVINIHGNGRLINFDDARPTCSEWKTRISGPTWHFVSTLGLLFPDKGYQVSDELESFFFLFLFIGLHFIAHNKPGGLDVNSIFDDIPVRADGHKVRGLGKVVMYLAGKGVMLEQLQFEKSPPFTDLIRELFRLFRSLAMTELHVMTGHQPSVQDAENAVKLRDYKEVIRLIKDARDRMDWPDECDKVENGNYNYSALPSNAPALLFPTITREVPKQG